jgi:hypothetical protein
MKTLISTIWLFILLIPVVNYAQEKDINKQKIKLAALYANFG